MGSLDRGVLTGFICRLCSEMHRVVLHIYGEEGIRLSISEKISRYLSVNVSRSDPLPKTICKNCLERLENQHRLVMSIEAAENVLRGRSERTQSRAIIWWALRSKGVPEAYVDRPEVEKKKSESGLRVPKREFGLQPGFIAKMMMNFQF